jgi:hypothetical protein
MLIFGAIIIINFVCFHYAIHARMYVINVCFRRSPRWGGVYAFSSNCSARLPCTEDKLFVLYWMYKVRCVEVSLVLTYYLSLSDQKRDREASCCSMCVTREWCKSVRMWEREYATRELAMGTEHWLWFHCHEAALRNIICVTAAVTNVTSISMMVSRIENGCLVLRLNRYKYHHWER